jgi:hypothetical protein
MFCESADVAIYCFARNCSVMGFINFVLEKVSKKNGELLKEKEANE